MEYTIKQGNLANEHSDCIIAGIFEKKEPSEAVKLLDKASQGYISNLLKSGDINGEIGETLLLHDIPHVNSKRILLVGCGNKNKLDERNYKKVLTHAISALKKTNASDTLYCLSEINVPQRTTEWKIRQTIKFNEASQYSFNQLKSNSKNTKVALKKIHFHINKATQNESANQATKYAKAIEHGTHLAKDLGNLPANICTPTYLAKQAMQLTKKFTSLKTSVIEEAQMRKLGMNALLSVSKGSKQPAKLITIQYKGSKKAGAKPIVLVGKGITFDSGGISIKPALAMDEMKYDMCGAASVLGTLRAVAELKLPINVIGIIPSSENLPGGAASKPGDIVKSMSGQTIEILNTDAEGRLVLCDALTYCKKFKPDVVIDIATLTGAMVIALGPHATGLMSNNDKLAHDLITAGEICSDRAWRLPLWDDYQSMLDSNFADMANVGNRAAGSITAACFLARFTEDVDWAHLDIAGTAWLSGKKKGATGRPVALLTQYIINRCNK